MIYSTPEYCVLFTLTFVLYTACPYFRGRLAILSAASLVFYAWAGFFDTLIFLVVVVGSWLATALAARYPQHRRAFITGGITLMAAHLLFWKYAPWMSQGLKRLFPALGVAPLHLPLPVGISFFTLQGIAYLVDLNRGLARPIPFSRYFLFKSFFPQLVAGPIVRVKQLLPQIERLERPSLDDVGVGLGLFVLGFFKKVALADPMSGVVDEIFTRPGGFGRLALVEGLLAYTVQIWADFSGYTDMGRGCARALGIRLPENFLSPYLARSPSEFWQRWHVTLSQWIRDYIYVPLGGNQGSRLRVLRTLVLTMAISGLWHGANWTFLIWGLYHGLLLMSERIVRGSRFSTIAQRRVPPALLNVVSAFMMQAAVITGWLIFRAPSGSVLLDYIRGLARGGGTTLPSSSPGAVWLALAACAMIQVVFYYRLSTGTWLLSEIYARAREASQLRPALAFVATPWVRVAAGVVAGGTLAIILVASIFFGYQGRSQAFIYFQF